MRGEQRRRGDELAGRADPALEAPLGDERILQRRKFAAPREPFDGRDRRTVRIRRGYEAGRDDLAVDEHAARAADADRAAFLRAGEAAVVTQDVDVTALRRDASLAPHAVHREADDV